MATTLDSSNKKRVLKRYPGAYAKEGLMSGNWYVYRVKGRSHIVAGTGRTAKEAWAHAAYCLL